MQDDDASEPTIRRLFDLTGRVALVTGGTGHLGGALARAPAEAGATVVVSSRRLDRARAAAEELPDEAGSSHFGVELDQLDAKSIGKAVSRVLKRAGRLDILVSNAQDSTSKGLSFVIRASSFFRHSSFGFRHSGFVILDRVRCTAHPFMHPAPVLASFQGHG